jgi:hypothetical protein
MSSHDVALSRNPNCHFRGLLSLHSRYGPPNRSAAHLGALQDGMQGQVRAKSAG